MSKQRTITITLIDDANGGVNLNIKSEGINGLERLGALDLAKTEMLKSAFTTVE